MGSACSLHDHVAALVPPRLISSVLSVPSISTAGSCISLCDRIEPPCFRSSQTQLTYTYPPQARSRAGATTAACVKDTQGCGKRSCCV